MTKKEKLLHNLNELKKQQLEEAPKRMTVEEFKNVIENILLSEGITPTYQDDKIIIPFEVYDKHESILEKLLNEFENSYCISAPLDPNAFAKYFKPFQAARDETFETVKFDDELNIDDFLKQLETKLPSDLISKVKT